MKVSVQIGPIFW